MEPGWVEIIPLKRVTVQVRTWLLSAHTDTHQSTNERTVSVNGVKQRRRFRLSALPHLTPDASQTT